MTVPMLSDLVDIVGIDLQGEAKPTLEKPLLQLLIKHALPELSAGDIEELIGSRIKRKSGDGEPADSSLLLEHLEASEEVMDEKDVADLIKLKPVRSENSSAAASSGGPSVAGPPAKEMLPTHGTLTPEWAKNYCPVGKGIGITLDELRLHRWQGQYLGRKSPGQLTFSKAFGKNECNMTKRAALICVLSSLWAVHELETDEVCPWDLSA